MVVRGKGNEGTEMGSVHDEKQRNDEKVLLHLTRKERDQRSQVRLEPVEDRAIDTETKMKGE